MRRPIALASLAILAIALAAPSAAAQDSTFSRPPEAPAEAGERKSVTSARLIGIIPSAGHFYAGEPGRGLAFLGGMGGALALGVLGVVGECVGGMMTTDEDCGNTSANVASAAFFGIWGWSILDAGRAARRTNVRRGHASLTVAPTRAAISPTQDVTAVKVGLKLATR